MVEMKLYESSSIAGINGVGINDMPLTGVQEKICPEKKENKKTQKYLK